jgi:hypothetical protein
VKFTIEIYTTAADGSETLHQRTTFSALNPLAARKEASRLLDGRTKPGVVRVLNARKEILYQFDKDGSRH